MRLRRTRSPLLGSALALLLAAPPIASRADDASPTAQVALKDREITDLALTPEGDVLAATDQGVWRVSADAKSSAQLPTAGLPLPPEKCLVTHLACTRKGDVFAIPGRGTDGVYRLRAGASTWESTAKKGLFVGIAREQASSLSLMPDDTLLVSMSNPSLYRGETAAGRVCRSLDAGATWADISPDGLGGAAIASLVPGTGREVWAVAGPPLRNTMDPTRWVLVADDWRAARPRWRISGILPSQKPGAIVGEPSITAVAVDRRGVAYALVTAGLSCPPGVYRSMDKGASWQRTSDAQEIHVVLATPDDIAYVGTYGILVRSVDGGATWARFAALGKTFVTSLLVDRNGHLWAGTGSHGQIFPLPGLFRSQEPVGAGVEPGTGTADVEGVPTPKGPDAPAPEGTPGTVLFDNGNAAGVESGPTADTAFGLRTRSVVTRITTYHWNAGRGAKPGAIALRGADGRIYGPWTARAGVGQGEVANAYWVCEPGLALEPGTYVVIDSDPATWAQNASSGRRGIVRIEGAPAGGKAPPGR